MLKYKYNINDINDIIKEINSITLSKCEYIGSIKFEFEYNDFFKYKNHKIVIGVKHKNHSHYIADNYIVNIYSKNDEFVLDFGTDRNSTEDYVMFQRIENKDVISGYLEAVHISNFYDSIKNHIFLYENKKNIVSWDEINSIFDSKLRQDKVNFLLKE